MEAVLEDIFQSAEFTVKPGQAQAYHHPPFPPPPKHSINEFIICSLNPLLVVHFSFISALLHA